MNGLLIGSGPELARDGFSLIRDTILHEIAHALVGPNHCHDLVWKAKCLEIGATPRRCGASHDADRQMAGDLSGVPEQLSPASQAEEAHRLLLSGLRTGTREHRVSRVALKSKKASPKISNVVIWNWEYVMKDGEIFSQQRMDRCVKIEQAIMANWQKTKSLAYTVRCTDSVEGISLGEFRKRYFTVGVGTALTDIPFIDLLVVFSLLEQQVADLKAEMARQKKKGARNKEFSVRSRISTSYTDEEAVRILSQIRIETPHDKTKYLRIVEKQEPIEPIEPEAGREIEPT